SIKDGDGNGGMATNGPSGINLHNFCESCKKIPQRLAPPAPSCILTLLFHKSYSENGCLERQKSTALGRGLRGTCSREKILTAALHGLGLGLHFFQVADVQKRLLGQAVVFAVADGFEAFERVVDLGVHVLLAG